MSALWADWPYHWLPLFYADFFRPLTTLLSAITCPLGPNVNSWDTIGASREPTFPLCKRDLCGHYWQNEHTIGFPHFLLIFLDHLRPCQCIILPPRAYMCNVNRWASLKTSTELTFAVFVICVGPVGRLGIRLAFPIFLETFHERFLRPFTTLSLHYPAPWVQM